MGYINPYDLFEQYYLKHLPGSFSSSMLTWLGSIQIFLFCLLATVSGSLFDSGHYQHVLLFGFVFQLLGVFATSFSTTYYQAFLSQDLCQGVGNGFVLCPAMSLISTYFLRRPSVAISTVASGSATRGVVSPLISQQLLPRIGFGWTVRIMGL